MGDSESQEAGRPWLQDHEWARGRALPRETSASIRGYWVTGLGALAGAVIVGSFAGRAGGAGSAVLLGLAVLLAICGVAGIALGARRARAERTFGRVWLALDSNPGVPGTTFRATLHAERGVPADAHASMRLVCTARYGNSRRNLWEQVQDCTAAGGVVPCAFDLPPDAAVSHPEDGSCSWILLARVRSAAATYTGRFEVPVLESRVYASNL